jgi:hypothetical protein
MCILTSSYNNILTNAKRKMIQQVAGSWYLYYREGVDEWYLDYKAWIALVISLSTQKFWDDATLKLQIDLSSTKFFHVYLFAKGWPLRVDIAYGSSIYISANHWNSSDFTQRLARPCVLTLLTDLD